LLYGGGYFVQRRAPAAQRPEIRKAQAIVLAHSGYFRRVLHLRSSPVSRSVTVRRERRERQTGTCFSADSLPTGNQGVTWPPGLRGCRPLWHDRSVRPNRLPSHQVADDLRQRIKSGEWQPGEQLPSVAKLAAQYGVVKSTAFKAVHILTDEGLLNVVPNWGVFISSGDDA
jgi:GntR family transcriptional regulator